jgi:hypothetical protein
MATAFDLENGSSQAPASQGGRRVRASLVVLALVALVTLAALVALDGGGVAQLGRRDAAVATVAPEREMAAPAHEPSSRGVRHDRRSRADESAPPDASEPDASHPPPPEALGGSNSNCSWKCKGEVDLKLRNRQGGSRNCGWQCNGPLGK